MFALRAFLLLSFVLILSSHLNAQKYFEQYFSITSSIQGFYAEGDTVFGIGAVLNPQSQDPEGVIYRIVGSEVEEIYRVAVPDERHTFYSISGNENVFIIGGVTHFADGTQGPSYYIYDRATETHERVTFHEGGGGGRFISKLSDGSFLLSHSVNYWDGAYNEHPFLVKMSGTGELLWSRFYYEYESRAAWATPFEDNQGNVWLPGFIEGNDEANTAIPVLFRVNEIGDVVEELDYQFYSAGALLKILSSPNGTLFSTGQLSYDTDCLYSFTPEKEINWILPLSEQNSCGVSELALTVNGFIHTSSCYSDPNELGSTDARIVIVDTSGNLVRSVIYGGEQADYFYTMVPTADGGFLHGGSTDSFGGAQAYLVKTNCMGLLTEPEASYDYSLNDLEIEFQNHSQFVYQDSLDGGHFIWEVNGVEFSREEKPSFTFTEMGAYNLTLSAIVCSDTSVYNQCISLDGTECWALGLNDDMTDSFTENNFVLSPNPTNGLVTIESSHTWKQARLFDLQGRLLIETSNSSLDLIALPAATYFVEIELVNGERLRNKLCKF